MSDARIEINPEACMRDGLCVRVCPARIFRADRGGVPEVVGESLCVKCGQCIAICPCDAITHTDLDLRRFERIEDRHPGARDAFVELLRQRRSVREYRDKPIPRELLEEVVGAAAFAPTGAHGGEAWKRSVVVVSGEEMRRVTELTAEYMRRLGAMLDSWVVKAVATYNEQVQGGRAMLPDLWLRVGEYEQGHDIITYDAPVAVFVHTPRATPTPQIDCDAALYAILLAAHARGLGACWNGWLQKAATAFKMKTFTDLRQMLGIPDDHDVLAAATLGYPALRLHSVPQREIEVRFV